MIMKKTHVALGSTLHVSREIIKEAVSRGDVQFFFFSPPVFFFLSASHTVMSGKQQTSNHVEQ